MNLICIVSSSRYFQSYTSVLYTCHYNVGKCRLVPVSVAARSKAQVCGCSHAEILGSNPTGITVFVVSVVCCQVKVSATS